MPRGFAIPPAEPLNVAPIGDAATVTFLGGGADWKGDSAHPIPRRLLFAFLRGAVEITASDGIVRVFRSGDVLLAEDTWGEGHASRIIGEADCLAVVVMLADPAKPA